MKTLSTATRLFAAATAIATTGVLFSGVISISEPQRSVLIAKAQHRETLPSPTVILALGTKTSAESAK